MLCDVLCEKLLIPANSKFPDIKTDTATFLLSGYEGIYCIMMESEEMEHISQGNPKVLWEIRSRG